jgi:uncharacterized membrane protein
MLRYFIQVVQTGLGVALITALLFGAAFKDGAKNRKKWLFRGCALGAASALVLAILRRTTTLINRTIFNAWIMAAAVIAALFYIALYWGLMKKKQAPVIRDRLQDGAGAVLTVTLLLSILPDIFLYPAEFLLAGETFFTTMFLFKCIGFTAGLALVVLTALGLFQSALGIANKLPGFILTLCLSVNILNQATGFVQFLFARRMVPMIRWLFRIMLAGINNSIVFLFVILGISFILPLTLFIKSFHPPQGYRNPAEHRKIRAAMRSCRRWCMVVAIGCGVALASVTAVKSYAERGVTLSPAEPMTIAGAEILIPMEQIQDGHLHRFAYYTGDNTEVRFIVIRKNDIAYGVGLDACDICGPTGYYERKDQVICRLCDVVMNISTIGFKGGCNPVPLAYSLRNGAMVIEIEHLENEKGRFK